MKRIFTADLHLQRYQNDPKKLEDGSSMKLKELLDCFRQVAEYAKENSMEVIIGGDIAHHKDKLETIPFVRFKKVLDEYPMVTFVIFEGNHGRSSAGNEDIGIELLNSPNVKILKDPCVEGNITFIPDSNVLYENIKNADPNKILCSHFPVTGAKNDMGFELETKFKMDDLAKWDLILLGDIHNHQMHQLTSGGKLYYSGSLVPTDRSETEQKGFIVFDDETLEVEFIPVTGYRQYHNIVITEKTNLKEVCSKIEELKQEGHTVIVKKEIAELPKKLRDITEDVQVVDLFRPDYNFRGITSGMNIDEQFTKYMDIMNISEEDKPKYLTIIKSVLFNEKDQNE